MLENSWDYSIVSGEGCLEQPSCFFKRQSRVYYNGRLLLHLIFLTYSETNGAPTAARMSIRMKTPEITRRTRLARHGTRTVARVHEVIRAGLAGSRLLDLNIPEVKRIQLRILVEVPDIGP